MPVETANTIDELDPSLPSVSDPLTEGDDHIRLIKQVLKNTFTGFEGEDASVIEARFQAIEDRLDALEAGMLTKLTVTGGDITVNDITADSIVTAASSTIGGALTVDQNISCIDLNASGTVSAPTIDSDNVTSSGNVTGFDGS